MLYIEVLSSTSPSIYSPNKVGTLVINASKTKVVRRVSNNYEVVVEIASSRGKYTSLLLSTYSYSSTRLELGNSVKLLDIDFLEY